MPTVRGREDVRRFIARLPAEIERKVLRGAARAAANVVADDARDRALAQETRDAITVKSRAEPGRMVVRITVKPGWGRSIGYWLEYGTHPHFISVDDSQRDGMSVRRVNDQVKKGSLVIGGNFVGTTVHHRGAKPYPFLRPALDTKASEAIAAAQGYINARVKPAGIVSADEPEVDDE